MCNCYFLTLGPIITKMITPGSLSPMSLTKLPNFSEKRSYIEKLLEAKTNKESYFNLAYA